MVILFRAFRGLDGLGIYSMLLLSRLQQQLNLDHYSNQIFFINLGWFRSLGSCGPSSSSSTTIFSSLYPNKKIKIYNISLNFIEDISTIRNTNWN
jgi:hypothetical protein